MSKIAYADYQKDDFNTPVPMSRLLRAHGPVSTARLGPFHVPDKVDVTVTAQDLCTFSFAYPNDEAPERVPRTIHGDTVDVILGKHSRKVVAVIVRGARKRLRASVPILNPAASGQWCMELDLDRRFVCNRNAEVISAILTAMPSTVRDAILTKLDEDCGGTGAS